MPYADVNGQRLYYEDSGGSGMALVLAHGLLMDHEMFAAQVAALSGGCRVVTWDERGHGLTEALAAGLPCAGPVVWVPGAGHASNLTHPEPVNAAIAGFLRGLRA